jgi:hypothetical protein
MFPVMLFLYSGYDTDYELLVPLSSVDVQTGLSECLTSFCSNLTREFMACISTSWQRKGKIVPVHIMMAFGGGR